MLGYKSIPLLPNVTLYSCRVFWSTQISMNVPTIMVAVVMAVSILKDLTTALAPATTNSMMII